MRASTSTGPGVQKISANTCRGPTLKPTPLYSKMIPLRTFPMQLYYSRIKTDHHETIPSPSGLHECRSVALRDIAETSDAQSPAWAPLGATSPPDAPKLPSGFWFRA